MVLLQTHRRYRRHRSTLEGYLIRIEPERGGIYCIGIYCMVIYCVGTPDPLPSLGQRHIAEKYKNKPDQLKNVRARANSIMCPINESLPRITGHDNKSISARSDCLCLTGLRHLLGGGPVREMSFHHVTRLPRMLYNLCGIISRFGTLTIALYTACFTD